MHTMGSRESKVAECCRRRLSFVMICPKTQKPGAFPDVPQKLPVIASVSLILIYREIRGCHFQTQTAPEPAGSCSHGSSHLTGGIEVGHGLE